MSDALINKYRPEDLDEVIGQDTVVRALGDIIERGGVQTFLFSSSIAGVGKTTLARLVAKAMGCLPENIIEKDGATYTGVESMRELQSLLQYRPFGKHPARALIIDECHRLSGNAWDSVLKATEEPPPDTYWFFCTTNINKVPKTIQSRGAHFALKPVPDKVLGKLYDDVCEAEDLNIPGDVGDMLIKEANGSPRQMLSNIAVARTAKDRKEAAALLKTAIDSDATLELYRMLSGGGGSWPKAMAIVDKIEDDPEGVRIRAVQYFSKALKSAKTGKEALFWLGLIDAFAVPYNPAEGIAPLLLSIGRAMFSPKD